MSFYLQPILQNKCSQSTTDLKVTGHSRAHRYASRTANQKLDAILVRPLLSPILALCCATVQLQIRVLDLFNFETFPVNINNCYLRNIFFYEAFVFISLFV